MAKNYVPTCNEANNSYTYSELRSDFPSGMIQSIGNLPTLDRNNSFEDINVSWDLDQNWLKQSVDRLKRLKLIPELIPPIVPTIPTLPPMPQQPTFSPPPTEPSNPSMPSKPPPPVYPKPKRMIKKPVVSGVDNVSYIQLGYGPSYINLSQLVALNPNGVNVTRGRKVTGTSTFSYGSFVGKPELAVDGNEKPRDWPFGVYHSKVEKGGDIFEVTLDEPTTISELTVYNRTSHSERMKGHVVKLLDADKNVLWTSTALTTKLIQKLPTTKPKGSVGNVSYVHLGYGNSYINISQLVGTDVNGKNVTKGRPASGPEAYDGYASNAVDGGQSSRPYPYIYHSSGTNQHLEVKLDGPTTMSSVTVYNRGDCCGDRLAGHVVKFLDSNRNVLWTSTPLKEESSQTVGPSSTASTISAPPFDNFKVYVPGDIVLVNDVAYIMTSYIGASGYPPLGYPAHWKIYVPADIEPSDCGNYGKPSSDNVLRLYDKDECTSGLKGSWTQSSICYQDNTNDFETSYSNQCSILNTPDPAMVQYNTDMQNYNNSLASNKLNFNSSLTSYNKNKTNLQNAYQDALDEYHRIYNQIIAIVTEYNNKATIFNNKNNKYRKYVSDQYCFYNNMLKYADSSLFKSSSNLDVTVNTPTVNNKFNIVQHLKYKLVILKEIGGLTFVDNVKLLSKNIPPVLEGFMGRKAVDTASEDINQQYNILNKETKRQEKNKRLIEYTVEKNNANQNLLTLFGILNIVAIGIIYKIASY